MCDAVAPFLAPLSTDVAALRAAESLAVLPADPIPAAEEFLRRREEIGYSYVVIGAHAADALAPVVSELAGRKCSSGLFTVFWVRHRYLLAW